MERVISRDGTPIAFNRTGTGRPLLLVHGTGASHTRWKPVLPALQARFTVYAMDRRGRGESLDTAEYAIEREFEDVAAVVDAVGGPVDVIGHSWGGICSVEAALLTPNIRRLVLYEPPLPSTSLSTYTREDVQRLEGLMARNDREGILAAFFRGYVGVPKHDFEALRISPAWPARLAAAHTIPRELRAHLTYRFRPERFENLDVPALLLLGGESPKFFQEAISVLKSSLPKNRVAILPGQLHVAIDTAPELFLEETLKFLDATGG